MGKLIISTTMTVDAVIEVTDWYVSEGGHERAGQAQLEEASAVLLGRKTYEGLAGYWSPREGPWADLLNPMPKFVASRTLREPLEWNATLLDRDAVDAVPKLKDDVDGDLIMFGCGELARDLLSHGLVDELRFWLHPSLRAQGARPFEGAPVEMRLLDSATFDSGVALLRYAPTRGA